MLRFSPQILMLRMMIVLQCMYIRICSMCYSCYCSCSVLFLLRHVIDLISVWSFLIRDNDRRCSILGLLSACCDWSKVDIHLSYPSLLHSRYQIVVPKLPSKAWKRQLPFRADEGIFDEEFIEERRKGLEGFINKWVIWSLFCGFHTFGYPKPNPLGGKINCDLWINCYMSSKSPQSVFVLFWGGESPTVRPLYAV